MEVKLFPWKRTTTTMVDETSLQKTFLSDVFETLFCANGENIQENSGSSCNSKEFERGWTLDDRNKNDVARDGQTSSINCTSKICGRIKKPSKKHKTHKEAIDCTKITKFTNTGTLSYEMSSWRTIIDIKSFNYIERKHPLLLRETSIDSTTFFLDPATMFDRYLKKFLRQQRAYRELRDFTQQQSNCSKDEKIRAIRPLVNIEFQERQNSLMKLPEAVNSLKNNLLIPPITVIKKHLSEEPKSFPSTRWKSLYRQKDERCSQINDLMKPTNSLLMPIETVEENNKQKLNWFPISVSPCLLKATRQ